MLRTTIRLWTQRRVRAAGRHPWRVAAAVVPVLVVLAAGVAVGVGASRHPRSGARASRVAASRPSPGTSHVQASEQTAAAAAAGTEAAGWVTRQVSRQATVACDPAMYATLLAVGVPAANLVELPAGATAPADPITATLVVATAAVRGQYGNRLAGYAPVVLASFGTGTARVDIRVTAPGGGAAYLAALRRDQHQRRARGRRLLRSGRVGASGPARRYLAGGQVDPRLLLTLAALASRHRVWVLAFTGTGHGASVGVPLRSAELARAPGIPAIHARHYLRVLQAFLRGKHAPFRARRAGLGRLASGRYVLRVLCAAPSPLGLLGGHGG